MIDKLKNLTKTKSFHICMIIVIIVVILFIVGMSLGISITIEYFETLKVDRLPTAVLTICLLILSALSFSIGLIMNAIGKVIAENRRFKYRNF